jgi:hypothetical protein
LKVSTSIKPILVVSDEQKNTANTAIDVSDFAAIRLPPDFEREAGVRKQLTLVRVRGPRKQEWIRVHSDLFARYATITYKENDESKPEVYLVMPNVARQLGADEITIATLYLACNRQGEIFIWPCRDPRPGSRAGDLAATSRIAAAEAAMKRQVRVQWRSPAFEISFRDDSIPDVEPIWPDKSLDELVEIAFGRTGLVIRDLNHPVIKILQGRN